MKIETKGDVGQEVWFIEKGKAVKDTILRVDFSKYELCEKITYYLKDGQDARGSVFRTLGEDQIFHTKEELIASL